MLSREHTAASSGINWATTEALRPMSLHAAPHRYSGTNIEGRDRSKQGNHGWGPRRPPFGHPKRLSVTLEVAYSESDSKLNSGLAQSK
ncbi:uncharacterized protein N7529_009386 [Penicillium soppii]|uniref:uncharacterized protein n=1 Tax=Penicillium soppii TaxID=69789 RepID=UPI002546BAF6|nr:uncharacterized protein N7529_009386 [Penicillium soppii]KAJ5855442.1 hypothetical protein N7529_009386 [Penicillium soppii]